MDRKITFDDYRGIIRALADAEKGCPWDKAQTHESLKPCMIHEMTEAVAAVNLLTDTGDADKPLEELGDVLLSGGTPEPDRRGGGAFFPWMM